MTRDDVIALFKAWRAAGLRPNIQKDSAEQANQLIDAFLSQYSSVTKEEMQQLIVRLSRLQYWPRFYDVDEVLTDCRRQRALENKGGEDKKGLTPKEKRDKEIREMIGRELGVGENCLDAMANVYAGRHYKNASEGFMRNNRFAMAAQLEFDYECSMCGGKSPAQCKFGGHKPFLLVDKYTGDCTMLVDSAKCGKVFSMGHSNGASSGARDRSSGGFTAFGDVIAS